MVIAFGGPYRFPGFCGNQHIRDPTWSQNPFINRLGNRSRSCFVGFRCFGNTSCSFNVALICMHLPSFWFSCASSFHFAFISFHFPFILLSFVFIHVPSLSFHIPFIFIPMCIHVLSSFHLHACSFHFASMSFDFLSKVMEMALWLGQGTECNKWLSLSYRQVYR